MAAGEISPPFLHPLKYSLKHPFIIYIYIAAIPYRAMSGTLSSTQHMYHILYV
jgi:hypothetical protein